MTEQKVLQKNDFEPCINTMFKLIYDEKKFIELKLFKIEEKDSEVVYSFSLLFEGDNKIIARDNTYHFHHENIGDFSIFLSPYAKEGDKVLYESIFSRLKK